jgi:hypothetical protein
LLDRVAGCLPFPFFAGQRPSEDDRAEEDRVPFCVLAELDRVSELLRLVRPLCAVRGLLLEPFDWCACPFDLCSCPFEVEAGRLKCGSAVFAVPLVDPLPKPLLEPLPDLLIAPFVEPLLNGLPTGAVPAA